MQCVKTLSKVGDNMKKSYYAIIPANVRYDEDLTANAKLLYGEITALCNQEGYCWASNSYFAKLYEVSNRTISKWISQLVNKGYITREVDYKEGTKEVERRLLRIGNHPIEEKFNTPSRKVHDPMEEKFSRGMEEKFQENNTDLNNTSNSSSSSKGELNPFNFYENNFGVLNPFIAENIEKWNEDLSEELVIEAMKIALKNNKQFNYAEGILRDWHSKNIRTIDDVTAARKEFERKRNPATRKREVADFEID